MIQTYFDQLKRIVDRYATAPFVVDAQISFELRPGDQGHVARSVLFQDQSRLIFREFLDSSAGQISKLMYSYHYQDAEDHLVFRYDNARHRPPLAALDHKHVVGSIVPSRVPTLDAVLAEIATASGWT